VIDSGEEFKLSGNLTGFLDEPGPESGLEEESQSQEAGPALADREFYVEEKLLGKRESRFVREGGVRLVRVDSYDVTVDDLEPLAGRRVGIDDVRLVLLKFAFMIHRLPTSRMYSSVSVQITLRPAAPALMLRPRLETTDVDTEHTFTSQFAPSVARLLQLHIAQTRARTVHRRESLPVATAVNDGLEGFGWTFEAHDGAPLHPHLEFTVAMLELPLAATSLDGLFDAEAMISRRVLDTFTPRRAAPLNSAEEFSVNLPRSGPVG
jgi:hypothetical protein